jgi:hypothetical protein
MMDKNKNIDIDMDDDGYDNDYDNDYDEGYDDSYYDGYNKGYDNGYHDGYDEGHNNNHNSHADSHNDNRIESSLRPYARTKTEMAMLYFPGLHILSARKKFMRWLMNCPDLMEKLYASGYCHTQKLFNVRQVKLIFEYLGEP